MLFDWQAEFAAPAVPITAVAQPLVVRQAPPVRPPAPALSFAQVLSSSTSSPSANEPLPLPNIRGDLVSIRISQTVYEKGIDYCKRNLRGRLVLNKGDKPCSSSEIQQKLQKQWKTSAPWSLLSLGRGYFEFFFTSESDMRSVWAMGTVNLKPGLLCLFEWTRDFNMHKQKNTHAQVWIRLMELPQEYWMERTLREIASAVGTPLVIDTATTKRLYGHYTRILVDLDYAKKIFYEILVEREGFSFPVEVVYERLPEFCTHCQNIGHSLSSCRWMYPRKEYVDTTTMDKGKAKVPINRKEWVPVRTNPSGIGSSNAFEILADTLTTEKPLVNTNITENSFSFALQNVTDEVPHRVLPTVDDPLLTLVTIESQDAAKSPEGNRVSPVVDVTQSLVAAASTLQLDQVAVQEESNDDLQLLPQSLKLLTQPHKLHISLKVQPQMLKMLIRRSHLVLNLLNLTVQSWRVQTGL